MDYQELQIFKDTVVALYDCARLLPQCAIAERDKELVRRFIVTCMADLQDSRWHPLRLSLYAAIQDNTRECCRWLLQTVPTAKIPVVILVPYNGHSDDTDNMEAMDVY